MAGDVCSATEDQFFTREDVAFDGAVDLRYGHFDLCMCDFRAGADDQCTVCRDDVAGKVTVNSQHRFKADFAGEIYYVAYETKPIVFVSVRPVAINELRLAAFVAARNCLSSHCCCPSFCSFPVTR